MTLPKANPGESPLIDARRQKRAVRRALLERGLPAKLSRLSRSPMQSVFRARGHREDLAIRWRDRRDPSERPSAEKALLQVLEASGIERMPRWRFAAESGGAIITAFTFVAGRAPRGLPSTERAAALGRLLANMHAAARNADLREGSPWDVGRFRGLWKDTCGEMEIPARARDFAEAAFDAMAAIEADIAYDRACWGVIHSDLTASNVLFSGDVPGFIDFAEAGPGLYAWDAFLWPFDCWWDYGREADPLGDRLFAAYAQAGGGLLDSAHLRACAVVRIAEAFTWVRPSLGDGAERCTSWIARISALIDRFHAAPPSWTR